MTLENTCIDGLPGIVHTVNVQPEMWLRSKQDKVKN
jgi:hypothetical protein